MDDFVVNVRQISQYPQGTPGAADAFLFQVGGIGGAYNWTNAAGLLAPLVNSPVTFGQVSLTGPVTWTSSGIDIWASGNSFGVYSNGAGVFTADAGGLWSQGGLTIADGSVKVSRAPIDPCEVVPAQYMADNTVWSFNGRRGTINLLPSDLYLSGGALRDSPVLTGTPQAPTIVDADQGDCQIANAAFVQRVVNYRINDLLYGHPFVFSFNNRIGQVCLTVDDVNQAMAQGIPVVPDAPSANYSYQIANTRWVTWQIDEVNQTIAGLQQTLQQYTDNTQLATVAYVDDNFAPINNPVLTGFPQAPTATPGTSTGQLATTAFVMNAVADSVAGVSTWNTRSGNVVMDGSDITAAGGALLASPAFTGNPTAPTQSTGTSNTTLATTGFVMNEISAIDAGVVTFNNRSGAVTLLLSDVTGVGGAPISNPGFNGVPTAPTAAPGVSTTQLATCAFVAAAVAANAGVTSFNSRTGAITLTSGDISAAGGAPIASPNFTGTPLGPTAAPGTSTTQLATTAFVQAALATGNVVSFNGRQGAVTLTAADMTNTGNFLIQQTNPQLIARKTSAVGSCSMIGQNYAGQYRWQIECGNATAETGNNGGSDFDILAFDDTGNLIFTPFAIIRATGQVSIPNLAQLAGYLPLSGGSLTGSLAVGGTLVIPPITGVPNPILQLNTSGGSGASQLYYSSSTAQTYLVNVGVNSYFVLGPDIQCFPQGGHNFLLQNGLGYQFNGGPWVALSDERIKTVTGDYEHGLDEIMQLRPVRFTFKGNDTLQPPTNQDPSPEPQPAPKGKPVAPYKNSLEYYPATTKQEFIGLVAQQAEGPMPEMVGLMNGYIDGEAVSDLRSMNTGPLTFALVNAVKNLALRVEVLEGSATRTTTTRKRA